ncbi:MULTISPECIES: PAAR domain-containing protein [Saccharopolyspora]|uniref:PAAR domain-containing protein n=1 Tax=Saccharopolyspora gregorii TaxID=33914 RepID=A0ABP6RP76_9PSEU|nr:MULTISPECIES: PAAR domain-containing protein [Saccharopolyspora]MCA1190284.1 PAAR domain-containing protein [Saccharopolyspora sp. 6T]MCA1195152.1 PAAR domain-containing protein [Saccharopolyspora sp. 6V]MCA1229802.1 PAAR domain-containing protein [Saccharopolyspora sp. 6M]MCA1281490.1 PAAR domain-containing protein [Saccharopolyspora sp. 7B]
MPPAARIGDATNHGGVVGAPPGPAAARVATVLIGGKPAAVTGSIVACPKGPDALLGPANVLVPSPPRGGVVLISGLPAAKMNDKSSCGSQVQIGAFNVLIGGPM